MQRKWKHTARSALGSDCWESNDGFAIVPAGTAGYDLMVPCRLTPHGAYSTVEAVRSLAAAKAMAAWPARLLGAALVLRAASCA